MLYIGLPGRAVPEWLEKIKPRKGHESEFLAGELKFFNLCMVWKWRGYYCIRPIFGNGPLMIWKGARYACMYGQGCGVVLNVRPIIIDFFWLGVVAIWTLVAVRRGLF